MWLEQEPSFSVQGRIVGIPTSGFDNDHYVLLKLIDPETNDVVAFTDLRNGDAQFVLEAAPPGEFEAEAKMEFRDNGTLKSFSASQRFRIERGSRLDLILALKPQTAKLDCAPHPSGSKASCN